MGVAEDVRQACCKIGDAAGGLQQRRGVLHRFLHGAVAERVASDQGSQALYVQPQRRNAESASEEPSLRALLEDRVAFEQATSDAMSKRVMSMATRQSP